MAGLAHPRPERRLIDVAEMQRLHLELLGEPCEVCERRTGTQLHHVKFRSRGGSDVRVDEKGRIQLLWICDYCAADHGRLPSISRYG